MKYIVLYEHFLSEVDLSVHFEDRFETRVMQTLRVKESVGSHDEILKRVKLLFEKLHADFSKLGLTNEKVLTIVDFGDIYIKKNGKITKPTFTCEAHEGTLLTGSVFCAPVYGNNAATILLFPRDTTQDDRIKQSVAHINRTENWGTDSLRAINYLNLNNKKIHVVDLDTPIEVFMDELTPKVIVQNPTKMEDLDYSVKADYIRDSPHRQGNFVHHKYGRGIILNSVNGMNGKWFDVQVKFGQPYGVKTFKQLFSLDYFKKKLVSK